MWPNLQETVDLVAFTEDILNGKLHFLCNVTRGGDGVIQPGKGMIRKGQNF